MKQNRIVCRVLLCVSLTMAGRASAEPVKTNVEVEVLGVEGELLQNVLANLTIEQQRTQGELPERRVAALHAGADDEIRRALRALGYYEPEIGASLDQRGEVWHARYVIQPGLAVIVRAVDCRITGEGESDAELRALCVNFPLESGDVMHDGRYEAGKRALQRRADARGYFDARFTQSEVKVNLDEHGAGITLHLDTKTRYRFGEIDIPKVDLNEGLIRRYITFEPGDPYSTEATLETQRALNASNYFTRAEVVAQRERTREHRIPIVLNLELRKPQRYTAGLGFGTDTGPRLRLGWESRYLNERGHKLRADLRISPVLRSLDSQYIIPIPNHNDRELAFTGNFTDEDADTTESRRAKVGGTYSHDRAGWRENLSLNYLLERSEVGDEGPNTAGLLLPGIGWYRVWNDSPLYTTSGQRLQVGIQGASDALLSTVSVLHLLADGKIIRSVTTGTRVILRSTLGAALTDDFEELPSSLRFFAGGDNSIRGFDYKDLGPRNDRNEIVGGRYLAVGSVELEQRVIEKWSVAAFSDFGNAFNDWGDDIEYSAGVGLRWLSPIGLVRVDVAAGLSRDDFPLQLHIVVGPDL